VRLLAEFGWRKAGKPATCAPARQTAAFAGDFAICGELRDTAASAFACAH
jgi:hypothetical protein